MWQYCIEWLHSQYSNHYPGEGFPCAVMVVWLLSFKMLSSVPGMDKKTSRVWTASYVVGNELHGYRLVGTSVN